MIDEDGPVVQPARNRCHPRRVLGTVLPQGLQNLVNRLGTPSSLDFAVMGTVILLGVVADQQLQPWRQRRIALASAKARNLSRQSSEGAPA